MRRKDREVKDAAEIANIISEAKILHLGLFDGDFPYVVPVHYGYEFNNGILTLYIHSAKEGHKLDLISSNPNVCVEMECNVTPVSGGDVPCRYGTMYTSVIGKGKATLITDVNEKIHGLNLLMQNMIGKTFKISPLMAFTVAVIKVEITEYTAKARKNA